MIHHSCDRCGRLINTDDEVRYVVRLEVEAVFQSADESAVVDDSDRDHLMELDEILERGEALSDPAVGPGIYRRERFDLCAACHRQFAKNPVGREKSTQMDFSQN